MAKALVDLPDPLQTPADAGKPLTSTDDLLAQLAGEEIDRLLAEVDDQGGAAVAAPAPVAGPAPATAPAPAPAPAGAAERLSRPIELSGVPDPAPQPAEPPTFEDDAPATVAAVAAAAEPDVTAELDAFFKTAVKPPAPAPEAAAGTASRPGANVSATEEPAAPADLAETTAAEREGLNAPLPAAAHAPPAAAPAVERQAPVAAAEGVDDAPLPLYLKPLEWINAPLEACPSALRDFIGKAAIVTLVNAAAVLAYVMLFRR